MSGSDLIKLCEKPPIYIDRRFLFCIIFFVFTFGVYALLWSVAPQDFRIGEKPPILIAVPPVAVVGVLFAGWVSKKGGKKQEKLGV